tara:strand:- start:11843 stop:12562 length:720 start_codon:yes stop_codon:yes gene_type:complete
MKKEEIKRDPVVDKILYFVSFLRNNLLTVLAALVLIIIVVFYVGNESSKNETARLNAIDAVDKIMVDLINSGVGIANLSNDFISKVDSLSNLYPSSEEVAYLNFLILQSDSAYSENIKSIEERFHILENISNDWFKSQVFLLTGDNLSDQGQYEKALYDYNNSLKFSNTNLQKAYVNYKIGLMYTKLDNYEKSYEFHNDANNIFTKNDWSDGVKNNAEYKDWKTRNDIALNKLKIILKK